MPFDAICLTIPAMIKAVPTSDGRRLIDVEVSKQVVDLEGDVILQRALLDSAVGYVRNGHVDVDHYSEIGGDLDPPIPNPKSYIVGRPINVTDLGGGSTGIRVEIMRSADGTVDARKNQYDMVWESLQAIPPVPWRASIYGFPLPDGIIDTRITKCAEFPDAKRYVVKSLDWRSTALTLNPICSALTGTAQIVTAKAFTKIMKSRQTQINLTAKAPYGQMDFPAPSPPPPYFMPPRNRLDLLGHYHGAMKTGLSPYVGGDKGQSRMQFREHFMNCCMLTYDEADILSLALAQLLKTH